MINVSINGVQKSFEEQVSVYEACADINNSKCPIVLCTVNGKLTEMFHNINDGDVIKTIDISKSEGMKAYERGISLLFLKAFYRIAGASNIKHASFEYGLGRGVYCQIEGPVIDDTLINAVKDKMKYYVEKKLPIVKNQYSTDKVIDLFRKCKMYDKERLFKYRVSSMTNVYSLGDFTDYFYGYMPCNTEYLNTFDIKSYRDGIVIIFPDKKETDKIGSLGNTNKLFDTLEASNRLADSLGVRNVGELNEVISNGEMTELILLSEALQEKKMAEIAEAVKEAGDKKFVMIAGPSSSGKTTFSHRLSIQLKLVGFIPHPIALDNYYKNRDECPKDEDGNYDFECLEALDVELFNSDMSRLLNGEEVELPTFNFKTGRREYKGDFLKLSDKDILVIEGIHGLNDSLSHSLPKESKFKIYISALTQLNIDEHNRIPTTDGRLLRRIVRDARTRGTTAKETITMWDSVRRGEEKFIFPFQEEADAMFNSALLYEFAVIKTYAEPLLMGIKKDEPEYNEARRLLKFLEYFLGVDSEKVPHNSIVREFIGGSYFNV